MGLDPALTYDFETRLTVQEEILKRADALYATVNTKPAITDRTPLDMLAYTMSEAVGNAVPERLQSRLDKYVRDCISVTNKRFSAIVVVQPGIQIVHAEGKAAPNVAYMEHLNSLILGYTIDERLKVPHFYIPRRTVDMEERLGALKYVMSRVIRRAEEEVMGASLH